MAYIPLTQGKMALVDDEDFDRLNAFKWCALKRKRCFYAARWTKLNGKLVQVLMHRDILPLLPAGKEVDHVNNDGIDNRKANLRVCTRFQNKRNSRKHSDNFSGLKGVSWHAVARKWQAHICANRVGTYLGLFSSKIEAANAYDDAALELHGEFAKLNFPFVYG